MSFSAMQVGAGSRNQARMIPSRSHNLDHSTAINYYLDEMYAMTETVYKLDMVVQ